MSVYVVEYSKSATKALRSMPRNLRELIVKKIELLAVDPLAASNVKELVGRPAWRLRVGEWRVIYTLESGRLMVRVLDIGPRGGIYQ